MYCINTAVMTLRFLYTYFFCCKLKELFKNFNITAEATEWKTKSGDSSRLYAVIRLNAIANTRLMTKLNSRVVCAVAILDPRMEQIKETGGGCEVRKRRNE